MNDPTAAILTACLSSARSDVKHVPVRHRVPPDTLEEVDGRTIMTILVEHPTKAGGDLEGAATPNQLTRSPPAERGFTPQVLEQRAKKTVRSRRAS